MLHQSIKAQAMVLASANLFVRLTGFGLRIFLSRTMGAECMGIMELVGSVHMLAITPSTAGLPLSISRLTAIRLKNRDTGALVAGQRIVNRLSFFMIPLYLLLIPWIARALGDYRCVPSLICTAPCIWILGRSAVLNGYCYGCNRSFPPAFSEVIEQLLRLAITVSIITFLPGLNIPWMAAVPAFATMAAESAGLVFASKCVKANKSEQPDRQILSNVLHLSFPPTVSRFLNTALRSATAMIIPFKLQATGLTPQEATARLGMLNGMAMPFVMLPGIFTSALSMVSSSAMAARENNLKQLRRLAAKLFVFSALISAICAMFLYIFSDLIAMRIYRQPDLGQLLRILSPSVVLVGISQVLSGMAAGIGLQKQTFWASLAGALINLPLTWLLTGNSHLRLSGTVYALTAGQAVCVIWQSFVMVKALKYRTGDKSCAVPQ